MLSLYEEGASFFLEFVGLRFEGPETKALAGSHLTFRRVSFVGGPSSGGPSSTEFDPEGVLNFYESNRATCEQCVVIDSLKLSDDSAEDLGAFLSVSNGPPNSMQSLFSGCISANNGYKGFAFEVNGSVTGARVEWSYSVGNSFGLAM